MRNETPAADLAPPIPTSEILPASRWFAIRNLCEDSSEMPKTVEDCQPTWNRLRDDLLSQDVLEELLDDEIKFWEDRIASGTHAQDRTDWAVFTGVVSEEDAEIAASLTPVRDPEIFQVGPRNSRAKDG